MISSESTDSKKSREQKIWQAVVERFERHAPASVIKNYTVQGQGHICDELLQSVLNKLAAGYVIAADHPIMPVRTSQYAVAL
ncbi:MAG TPA: hypothetical protein PLL92_12835 [Alicycliphilus sp.]|nr:hypothetical protein [Alicycliphilus sp.]